MSLTTCPDCGSKISTSAPACVSCGRPMGGLRPRDARQVTSIEKTSKDIKLSLALSRLIALIILARIWWMLWTRRVDTTELGYWILAAIVLVIWKPIIRLCRWWRHD